MNFLMQLSISLSPAFAKYMCHHWKHHHWCGCGHCKAWTHLICLLLLKVILVHLASVSENWNIAHICLTLFWSSVQFINSPECVTVFITLCLFRLELLCAGRLEELSTSLSCERTYAALCFEWLVSVRAQCIFFTFKVLFSTCTKCWTETK